MKTIPRDRDRIWKVKVRGREWECQSEDVDAVNCTHSRARWAVRTLIPFQAMSPLQNRVKWRLQKTNTSVREAHFLPYTGLPIFKQAQREVENLLQSPKWRLGADGEDSYLLKLLQTSLHYEGMGVSFHCCIPELNKKPFLPLTSV